MKKLQCYDRVQLPEPSQPCDEWWGTPIGQIISIDKEYGLTEVELEDDKIYVVRLQRLVKVSK